MLFEFHQKLPFGKTGAGAEQLQERIGVHFVLRRRCGRGGRLGGLVVPIDSFGLDQHFGNRVWTGRHKLNQLLQAAAVLRRAGEELDAHTEFGVHQPHDAFRLDGTIGGAKQQLDPRLRRKGRWGAQEASPKTESQERTADGRIVFLAGLRTQPFFQALVRGVRKRCKLDAGMMAFILPGNGSGGFDHGGSVRQGKAEADRAAFLAGRSGKTNRHPALAQAGYGDLLALTVLKSQIGGDLHLQPHGAAPLPFHKSAGGAKTRLRLLGGNRLEHHEVSTQLERGLQIGASFYNGDRHGLTVLLTGTYAAQQAEAALVLAVDDDGLKRALGQLFGGTQVIAAMLDVNFQFTENTAQNTHSAVVRTNQ